MSLTWQEVALAAVLAPCALVLALSFLASISGESIRWWRK